MIKIRVTPCQTSPSLTILVTLWFISIQLFRERLSYKRKEAPGRGLRDIVERDYG